MPYPIGVTKSLQTWNSQHNSVERVTDNSAYDAAHPDDTLILAGPARKQIARSQTQGGRTLLPIGMLTGFTLSSQAPVTPMQAIGSGRSFYLRGKGQSSWSMQRVLMNGRNLLRVLNHNANETSGVDASQFDDPAAADTNSTFFVNLDSEMYYIPFGIAVLMRSKSRTQIGSCYMELCMLNTWGIQLGAGQPMVMESVGGFCDRVLPFQSTDAMGAQPFVGRNLMDAVLGLAPDTFPAPSYATSPSFSDASVGYDSSVVPSL
jgi:hypothetical protein